MISKTQMHILRSISIAGLFMLYKPQNTFQLFLALFLFMGAMFLDYNIFFNDALHEEAGVKN